MSSLHIDVTHVLKILPQVRPGPTYFILSISWPLTEPTKFGPRTLKDATVLHPLIHIMVIPRFRSVV